MHAYLLEQVCVFGFEVLWVAKTLHLMTVSLQIKLLLLLNFAVWDTIAKKELIPANNCNLKVYALLEGCLLFRESH